MQDGGESQKRSRRVILAPDLDKTIIVLAPSNAISVMSWLRNQR
jgi:hypothetical protein